MAKDLQINSLYIHPDLSMVEIKFTEFIHVEDEESDDGERVVPVKHTIEVPLKPKSGLCEDLKSLRRHGLAILGIELAKEAAQIKNWTVMRLNIAGNYLEKKSRVVMTLALKCDLTGKIVPVKVPQVTMYPKDDDKVKYHKAGEMTQLVEKIFTGCWGFLNGEFDESIQGEQIILFQTEPQLETHFVQ